jgi:hypothetical protein
MVSNRINVTTQIKMLFYVYLEITSVPCGNALGRDVAIPGKGSIFFSESFDTLKCLHKYSFDASDLSAKEQKIMILS